MRILILVTCALVLAFSAPARAAILNGRITAPGGAGVYPCDIDVFDNKTGALLAVSGDTTTATGDYSITVAAGKYDLVFQPAPQLHLFDDSRNGIQVTTTTTTNRTLVAGRYVSGRVLGSNGQPVVNANLNFHDSNTGAAAAQVQDGVSGPFGTFSALVPAGVWDVAVIPAVAARKAPLEILGVDASTVDAAIGDVAVQDGFLVSGTVTDQSFFPIADADLDVRVAGKSAKLFTPGDNTSVSGTASFVIPAGLYDITASPPGTAAFATRTAWAVNVNADVALPNLVLLPAVALTAHSVTSGGVAVPNVDCDVDSLPYRKRLQTPHDVSNATGDVSVNVPLYKFKVDFAPPVSSKLLPVVFDSLQITGVRNLGTIVHAAGHWVTVNVVEQFTGMPVQGVNLDFVDAVTLQEFLTVDDVTNAAGTAKVVTDQRRFTLQVKPAGAAFNTITLTNFRTLNDTTLNLVATYSTAGAGTPAVAGLELSVPWPNPAREAVSTAITSGVTHALELSAWDLAGRRVATVFSGTLLGRRTLTWDARDSRGAPVAPGVYLLRLSDGRTTTTRRVAVMK
ncbi:MAG: hypothetical protein ABL977_09885 [Candidatus Eisenbacteria bacterium]